jgi:hypothetical protein
MLSVPYPFWVGLICSETEGVRPLFPGCHVVMTCMLVGIECARHGRACILTAQNWMYRLTNRGSPVSVNTNEWMTKNLSSSSTLVDRAHTHLYLSRMPVQCLMHEHIPPLLHTALPRHSSACLIVMVRLWTSASITEKLIGDTLRLGAPSDANVLSERAN